LQSCLLWERLSSRDNRAESLSYTSIACASAMSELARNCKLEQALEISPQDVEAELGGLPEDHLHCARLAVNTLGEAIADCYRRRAPAPPTENPTPEEKRTDAHI
jgi:nitrogen fixation NifU-like protein